MTDAPNPMTCSQCASPATLFQGKFTVRGTVMEHYCEAHRPIPRTDAEAFDQGQARLHATLAQRDALLADCKRTMEWALEKLALLARDNAIEKPVANIAGALQAVLAGVPNAPPKEHGLICPRCGKRHEIERFTIACEHTAWAQGYRPFISGFICDGWLYRVEAVPVLHDLDRGGAR